MSLQIKNSFLELVDEDDERPMKRSLSTGELSNRTMSSVVNLQDNPFGEACSTGVVEEKRSQQDPHDPSPKSALQADASSCRFDSDVDASHAPDVDAPDIPEVIDCDVFDWQMVPSMQVPCNLNTQRLHAPVACDASRTPQSSEQVLEGHAHVFQTKLQQMGRAGLDPQNPRQQQVQQIYRWEDEPEVLDFSPWPSQIEGFYQNSSVPLGRHVPSAGSRVSYAGCASEIADVTHRMQVKDEMLQDTAVSFWHLFHKMHSHMNHLQPRPTCSPLQQKGERVGERSSTEFQRNS